MSPMRSHQEIPGEEQLLEVLKELLAPDFEEVVYLFDKDNTVPGREAPRGIRAVDLLRVVRIRKDGLEKLWNKIQKYDDSDDRASVDQEDIIYPPLKRKLIGILIGPKPGTSNIGIDVARYAYTIVKGSIFSDMLTDRDDRIVETLVSNLISSKDTHGGYPELLAFAVICHDYAMGLGEKELRNDLRSWIDTVCRHSQFSLEAIRADYGKLDYSKIHRIAIEIAWRKPLVESEFPQPEAYIRWGIHRERVDRVAPNIDRHKIIADILESIRNDESARYINIDHVEMLLPTSEMNDLWEYKLRDSFGYEYPEWQPFPLVVRLLVEPSQKIKRTCPKKHILYSHIACGRHHEKIFLDFVQDKGVFVASNFEPENNQPCQKIRAAITWASIGLWTRMVYEQDDLLRDTLAHCPIEDVPWRIHGRRINSELDSVWRHTVLLYDPDLPHFYFSDDKTNSSHQQMVTAALR